MPKIVDHEARRAEIAEAVRRVLLREGVAGTTVRAVVADSGMSSGAIRHYFAQHDEMLRFAAEGIAGRVEKRIVATLSRQRRNSRARAVDIMEQFLPLDAERRMEIEVFTDLIARDPNGEWGQRMWSAIRACARAAVLVLAGEQPAVVAESSPLSARRERLAERLHLIADGLSAGQLFYGAEPDGSALRSSLRRAVDDVAEELASAHP